MCQRPELWAKAKAVIRFPRLRSKPTKVRPPLRPDTRPGKVVIYTQEQIQAYLRERGFLNEL